MKCKKRVLCVDDNPKMCDVVSTILHTAEVQTVQTVAAALAMTVVQQFDLFILDIQLPDGWGTDLLITLRADHPDTPAILMTTMPDITKDEAREIGAVDLIQKCGGSFVRELEALSENIFNG